MAADSEKTLLDEFKSRHAEGDDFWGGLHEEFAKTKRFSVAKDGQWSVGEKEKLGEPAMQINRVLAYCNQVTNTFIKQEIGCTVEPSSVGASEDLANVRQAQLMTLWRKGNGVTSLAYATREAIWGGYGIIKDIIGYAGKDFNKTIRWEALKDSTTFYCDPSADGPALSDMDWAFEEHDLTESAFKKKFGNLDRLSGKNKDFWTTESGKQKVFEYWRRIERKRKRVLLKNGKTAYDNEVEDKDSIEVDDGGPVGREVSDYLVEQYILGNDRILIPKKTFDRCRLPYKVAEGRVVYLDGKRTYQAMTTHAMNPQKKYNYIESQKAILFSKGPSEVIFVPAESDPGAVISKLNEVARNGSRDVTVIPYKSISDGGEALREPTFKAQLLGDPTLTNESVRAEQEIEACFGMTRNSWMAKPQDASGISIERSEEQGETSNFDIIKNALTCAEETLRDALEITPKLSISMQVKLAGEDQKDKVVWVNGAEHAAAAGLENYNLDEDEEYELYLKVSPSEKTMRDKAFDQLIQIAEKFPTIAPAIPDLVIKAGTSNVLTEAMAKRAQKMIPPQVLDDNFDPRVAALKQQLQQAGGLINQLQQEAGKASQTAEFLKQQLTIEKQKKGDSEYSRMLDLQIKNLEAINEKTRLATEAFQAVTERKVAENERIVAMSPAAQIAQPKPTPMPQAQAPKPPEPGV